MPPSFLPPQKRQGEVWAVPGRAWWWSHERRCFPRSRELHLEAVWEIIWVSSVPLRARLDGDGRISLNMMLRQ